MFKKFHIIFVFCGILGGCAVNELISPEAESYRAMISKKCQKRSIRNGYIHEQRIQRVYIYKITRGDLGWIRINSGGDGLWDAVYYNERTERVVCGQKAFKGYGLSFTTNKRNEVISASPPENGPSAKPGQDETSQ